MLYDREYMRGPQYRPSTLKPLYWLLGSLVAMYVLQVLLQNWFRSDAVSDYLALYNGAIEHGYIWTFLSYSFLHGGIFHLLINCIMLLWLGKTLIEILGVQRFFTVYALSVFLGGVAWFMVNFWQQHPPNLIPMVVGASGGVMGLMVAFAMHFPNKPIQVLLFFVIPVKVTPKTLVLILLSIDVAGLLFNELAPFGNGLPIAHSAHLGGMLGGWVFVKFILHKDFSFSKADIKAPKWFTSKKTSNAKTGRFRINFTNRRELQAEVDRILDKINNQGFGSLTEEERMTLDKAKELLNK